MEGDVTASAEVWDELFGFDSCVSAVVFTAWDNVIGTSVIKSWRNSHSENEVSAEAVRVVIDHAMKTEMSTEFTGVVSKFYCVADLNIIATVFLFVVPRPSRYGRLFSLTLALQLHEMKEWISRHTLLVDKMKTILEFNVIPIISRLAKQPQFTISAASLEVAMRQFATWEDPIELSSISNLPLMQQLQALLMKPRDLTSFLQLANSIRFHPLPDPDSIMIKETYLGTKLDDAETVHFLERAITAFLCKSSRAIVIGRRLDVVQKMMKTLSYFMLPNERKMSQMLTPSAISLGYQKGLFVQGFIYETNFLPTNLVELTSSIYRPVIIDVTILEVRQVMEPPVNPLLHDRIVLSASLGLLKGVTLDQTDYTCKRNRFPLLLECAPIIHQLLSTLTLLLHSDGTQQCYLTHYRRLLHSKALTLTNYVNENWTPAIGMVDPVVLMKQLSITNGSDLRLLVGIASKVDPSISSKVLSVNFCIPLFEYVRALKSVE